MNCSTTIQSIRPWRKCQTWRVSMVTLFRRRSRKNLRNSPI